MRHPRSSGSLSSWTTRPTPASNLSTTPSSGSSGRWSAAMAHPSSHGDSLLAHGNDWPGRAIAAEARVISLEQELRGEREAYLSVHRDVRAQFIDREGDLEETIRLIGNAYDAMINLVVLHEFVLRKYYENHPESPKDEFERAMHEIHQTLVIRS